MRHIDEGGLHAYLDGALDEYPTAEAARIRAHLDVCDTCRDRLAAERTIQGEAAAILGLGTPQVEPPSFEELRSFVHARAAARTATPMHRLGWAASVILAVGLGWLLRGGNPEAPEAAVQEELVASAPDVAGTALSEPARTAERGEVAPAAQSSPPAEQTELATSAAATSGSGLLRSRIELARPSVDLAGLGTPSPEEATTPVLPDLDQAVPPLPAPTLDTSGVPTTPLFAESGDQLADVTEERERPSSPSEVMTSAIRAVDASPFGRLRDDSENETPADDDSYSLVVPSLEVLEVRFRGGVRPEGQVVLQRLESGDTLRVIHLPMGIEPASLDEADPLDRQLVLQTSSGWIVMRAPVGEDDLMELMSRLLNED